MAFEEDRKKAAAKANASMRGHTNTDARPADTGTDDRNVSISGFTDTDVKLDHANANALAEADFEADHPSGKIHKAELAPPMPGVYGADGDDYGYEVLADGGVRVSLPTGGSTTVSQNKDSDAYTAIMNQIKSGQLARKSGADDLAPRNVTSPEPPSDFMGPPPEVAPEGSGRVLDPKLDPAKEMSRLRSEALKKATAATF